MSFNIYPTKEHPQVTIRNWILGILPWSFAVLVVFLLLAKQMITINYTLEIWTSLSMKCSQSMSMRWSKIMKATWPGAQWAVGGGQGDKDEMGSLGWGVVWGGVADSGFLRCHIKWQTHLGDFFLFASLDIVLSIFFLFGRRGSKNKCSNLATQFV